MAHDNGLTMTTSMETGRSDKKFDKELTLEVEIVGEEEVTVMELLKAVKLVCGSVVGCRMKLNDKYEITMGSAAAKEKMLDGFKIKGNQVMAQEINCNEMVVSFLKLPVYVTDEEILAKLAGWGVKAVTPIKRKYWPGTDIADGTRYTKVKFTETVTSLPYSAKFDTAGGAEYFRVIHDRHVKLCRLCIRPGHILRDCPDFLCHKCHMQGHYARECGQREEHGERGGDGESYIVPDGAEEKQQGGEAGEDGEVTSGDEENGEGASSAAGVGGEEQMEEDVEEEEDEPPAVTEHQSEDTSGTWAKGVKRGRKKGGQRGVIVLFI
ncbi:uncharacterized protein LOC143336370 isoform X2 [Chaetodon auriga]|uniref:uncharacterized protein LOC143336370 isoform X2 n=1 Tax=Chaetodon auriga TaxID=39042 RepID=UPI0040329B7D